MLRRMMGMLLFLILGSEAASAQTKQTRLSAKWEELSAGEFREAIKQGQGTCLLPFGILEKHGPHLPLGTDLLNVRYVTFKAVEQEYAVIFPEYYFGQIFEARHEAGTMAYSLELQLRLLQETADEMARNGCKKVVIVNGHGGNEHLLPLFAQAQLDRQRDYVVYVFEGQHSRPDGPPRKSTGIDYHAGENETSNTMIARPDLVHLDLAAGESGSDLARQKLPEGVYTGIWWYARFPNHYSGEGAAATRELGEWNIRTYIKELVEAIRAIKADDASLKLQNEFYEKSKHPLDTRP